MSDTRKLPKNDMCTYGDYLTWSDDKRWEIIDGEVFAMTPAPTPIHQEILSNLHALLWNFLRGKPCKVYPAPFDVRLPNGKEADEKIRTVVQPDILVICDEKKIDARGIRCAPDIVVEILSSSTASRDHILKRRLYEKHHVKEYWVIDPANRIAFLYRLTSSGVFGNVETLNDEDTLTTPVLPGLTIDLKEVFPSQPKRIVREPPKKYRL